MDNASEHTYHLIHNSWHRGKTIICRHVRKCILQRLVSVVALMFIEKYSKPPPMEFERLVDLVDLVAPEAIRPVIGLLSDRKRNSPELGVGEPMAEIDAFIESEFERRGNGFSGQGRPDLLSRKVCRDRLNAIFRIAIRAP